MAAVLTHQGVTHELITIPDGGHGFDADQDAPPVKAAFARVLNFLAEHCPARG
jgi:dienelactone hydrolase